MISTLPENVPSDTSPSQRMHSLKAPSTSPCSMLLATIHFFATSTMLHNGTLFASRLLLRCPTPSSHSSNYSESGIFKPRFFLTPKTFVIIHLNIQGLIGQITRKALGVCDTHSKIDYLHCFVRDDTAPDVICLTETKLSDTIDSSEIALPGYDVIRRDKNRQGGGIAIYWHSSLRAHVLDPLSNFAANIECCVIEADLKQNCTVCTCCVYKLPSTRLPEWEAALSHMLDDYPLMESLSY